MLLYKYVYENVCIKLAKYEQLAPDNDILSDVKYANGARSECFMICIYLKYLKCD